MRAPEIVAKLDPQGLYPAVVCGEAFGALLAKQYQEYGQAIRDANIKGE
jgi:tripartite-type tricarboxylate transporter receptor subunit TctC